MPAWIHDRADHIRSKNPEMSKSQSFAIATQQAYAAGKAPKSYGTEKGRKDAKKKYDSPKSQYKKTADPNSSHKSKNAMSLALWDGFADEIEKAATALSPLTMVRRAVFNGKDALSRSKPSWSRLPKMEVPQGTLPAVGAAPTMPSPPTPTV